MSGIRQFVPALDKGIIGMDWFQHFSSSEWPASIYPPALLMSSSVSLSRKEQLVESTTRKTV